MDDAKIVSMEEAQNCDLNEEQLDGVAGGERPETFYCTRCGEPLSWNPKRSGGTSVCDKCSDALPDSLPHIRRK